MSTAGKRALITGIHGFTGSFMATELAAQGCEVVGMGSQPSDSDNYHQVDLLDVNGLTALLAGIQPDIVVHLAALAFVGHGSPEAFYQVN
ncbi:NAD-dependent epimerase/dehydratase family protein, partial [Pseudomonas viridiflava]|uniref:NAD-dependent epimerase/dehydratase family protein n=1 Tax=Pseudomonas viridiflava TaxID=33069 RepID=UPI000F07ACF8